MDIIKDNSYRLVIKTTLNNRETMLEFDYIDPPQVTLSSQITEQPMVNGDIVADHMYKQPVDVSISGNFSLLGNKPTVYYGNGDRLTNIQETFEKIKNDGVFCTLITLSRGDNINTRFKARHNMVLQRMTWREKHSSVNFNLSFREVLLSTLNVVSPLYDVEDENLPAVTDAKTLNFTDELMDTNQVGSVIIKELADAGLIRDPENFMQGVGQWLLRVGGDYIHYTGAAAIAIGGTALVAIHFLLGIAAVSTTVPIWGWIVAAAAAVATIVIGAIMWVFGGSKRRKAEKKYGIKAFECKKNNLEQNEAEYKRFTEYLGSIMTQLNVLNDTIQLYACSSNANQSCIALIDGEYYSFTFVANNTTHKYNLKIENMQEDVLYDKEITGLASINECISANRVMQTSSGFEVYIFNKQLYNAISSGKTQEEIDEINLDLTNYLIMVSSIDLSNFNQTLEELVINSMIQ